jgi:hypothetical protein
VEECDHVGVAYPLVCILSFIGLVGGRGLGGFSFNRRMIVYVFSLRLIIGGGGSSGGYGSDLST